MTHAAPVCVCGVKNRPSVCDCRARTHARAVPTTLTPTTTYTTVFAALVSGPNGVLNHELLILISARDNTLVSFKNEH